MQSSQLETTWNPRSQLFGVAARPSSHVLVSWVLLRRKLNHCETWDDSFQFCFLSKDDLSQWCMLLWWLKLFYFSVVAFFTCFCLQMSLGHRSWWQKNRQSLSLPCWLSASKNQCEDRPPLSTFVKIVAQDSDWHTGPREHGLVLVHGLFIYSCHVLWLCSEQNGCRLHVLFDAQWQCRYLRLMLWQLIS